MFLRPVWRTIRLHWPLQRWQSQLKEPSEKVISKASLRGVVNSTLFRNENNGYTVCTVRVKVGENDSKLVTARGTLPALVKGASIDAGGQWRSHPKYGQQFEVEDVKLENPISIEAIGQYLSSGLVKGVGPKRAKVLTDMFGARTLEVIEHEPERLLGIPSIGPARAGAITKAFMENKAQHEMMMLCHGTEIGPGRAARIIKHKGIHWALETTRTSPYTLALEVPMIGFSMADSVARKLGVGLDSLERLFAGLLQVLENEKQQGNCALSVASLVTCAQDLLKIPENHEQVLKGALESSVERGLLHMEKMEDGTRRVWLRRIYAAERAVASRLAELCTSMPPWGTLPFDEASVATSGTISLTDEQQDAVRKVLRSKVSVLTGPPGVGKTTVLQQVVRLLTMKGMPVALAAPTGRAANRMAAAAGCEASTLHKLFKFGVDNVPVTGSGSTIKSHLRLLIVDESSMIDIEMAHVMLMGLHDRCGLLLVGDENQLPSIGPGAVLADIISSEMVTVARLKKILRQREGSAIVRFAHHIQAGLYFPMRTDWSEDCNFIQAAAPIVCQLVVDLVASKLPKDYGFDAVNDIQVLAPMKKGIHGVDMLNQSLQARLNPAHAGKAEVKHVRTVFRVGDKVMHLQNDYERNVANGDCGRIRRIDRLRGGNVEVQVEFEVAGLVKYSYEDLKDLSLSYAATVHKAQGSEFKAVVLPLTTHFWAMLHRHLFYTAITRARELVVIVGDERCVHLATQNDRASERISALAERIRILKDNEPHA